MQRQRIFFLGSPSPLSSKIPYLLIVVVVAKKATGQHNLGDFLDYAFKVPIYLTLPYLNYLYVYIIRL